MQVVTENMSRCGVLGRAAVAPLAGGGPAMLQLRRTRAGLCSHSKLACACRSCALLPHVRLARWRAAPCRPLKPEVNPLVAEAAHHAEVDKSEGDGDGVHPVAQGGCVTMC